MSCQWVWPAAIPAHLWQGLSSFLLGPCLLMKHTVSDSGSSQRWCMQVCGHASAMGIVSLIVTRTILPMTSTVGLETFNSINEIRTAKPIQQKFISAPNNMRRISSDAHNTACSLHSASTMILLLLARHCCDPSTTVTCASRKGS